MAKSMGYRKKIVEYEKLTAQLQELGIMKTEFMRYIGFNRGTIGKWSGACSAALGRIALRAHALSSEARKPGSPEARKPRPYSLIHPTPR